MDRTNGIIKSLGFILIAFVFPSLLLAQYKIMPLGNSITVGITGSNPVGGFRDDLDGLLSNAGVDFDFVGSQSDGDPLVFDPDHEGHNGWRADQLDAFIDAAWFNTYSPDIVLLHTGTNDISDNQDNSQTVSEIGSIIDKIHSYNSATTILLSSLIPRTDDKDATTTELNTLIEQLFYSKQAAGYNIYYVGQNEVFKANPNWALDYMTDEVHPNNTGYNVMARVYFNAIMNVINGIDITVTDNFNRTQLGITWDVDPTRYQITNNELARSSPNGWVPAIYIAQTNPNAVSLIWGAGVDAAGITQGGLALMLDSPSYTNANGYLAWIESNGKLDLWTIENGSPGHLVDSLSTGTLFPDPPAGHELKVTVITDGSGHYFDYYIDDQWTGRLTDPNKEQGNASTLYAGVMLRDGFNNNVDEFTITKEGDATSPAPVTDLAVESVTASSVRLTWTAPGDDGIAGMASSYDIRYSTSPITEDNFSTATQAIGIPQPSSPGTTEYFQVAGLESFTTYYFAVKTGDEVPNWSPISNVVSATTISSNRIVDDFNRADLGPNWTADPEYQIVSNELSNTATVSQWGYMAVYNARKNPVEVSFKWGAGADAAGIDEGTMALMLDAPSPDANGYMVWRRTAVDEFRLWTIVNGQPGAPVDVASVTFPAPVAGDVFKVVMSSDGSGHHFDCYINDQFQARLTDPDTLQGNADDLYAGVMLKGNLNNNIDDFTIVTGLGNPENLSLTSGDGQIDTVGTTLSEPLVVTVTDQFGNPIPNVIVDYTVIEGNGSLDLAPPPDDNIRIEAESGSITFPMTTGSDPEASGNAYIYASTGSPGEGQAVYTVNIVTAGQYVVWGRVLAPSTYENSFFVSMDGGADKIWDLIPSLEGVSWNQWYWDRVSERGSGTPENPQVDPVIFSLSAGLHTFTVKHREDNSRLDKIIFTNDLSFVPTGKEEYQQYQTNSDGQASAYLTLGTTAGINRVQAAVSGLTPVIFTATGVPDNPTLLEKTSGDQQGGNAGEQLPQPFVVTIKDQYNNPVPDLEVNFTVTLGGGHFPNLQPQITDTTDVNGQASTFLTLGDESDSNKVEVTSSALPGVKVEFMAFAAGIAAELRYVSGDSLTGVVGKPLSAPFKVKVLDTIGNPVENHQVSFTVKAGGGTLDGSTDTTKTVLTNSDGIAQVTLALGTTAGVFNNIVEVRATKNGSELNGSPRIFRASATADVPYELLYVSGDSLSGVIGTVLPQPFKVKVTDTYGNPINNHPVTFTVTAGGGSFDGKADTTVTTNADGIAEATLTLGTTAGLYNNKVEASASYNGNPLQNSPILFVATARASAATDLVYVSGTPQTGTAGSPLAEPFRVMTTDASGNPISDHPVNFRVVAGGGTFGSATDTTVYTSSDSGIAEVTLTLGPQVGVDNNIVEASATDGTNPLRNSPIQFTASAIAGPVDSTVSIITAEPDSVLADGVATASVTVTIMDTYRNPISGKVVIITSSEPFDNITQGTYFSDANGQVTGSISSQKAGLRLIGARVETETGTVNLVNRAQVVFTSGAAKRVAYESGQSPPQTRNVGTVLALPFVVAVTDTFGNPVSDYPVTFEPISGGGSMVEEQPVLTDENGEASSYLILGPAPGDNQVRAEAPGLEGSPVIFTATAKQGSATQMVKVAGDNQTGSANATLPVPLKVKLTDDNGDPVWGVPVTFAVTFGEGSVSEPQPTTDAYGCASTLWTLGNSIGVNMVTATASGISPSLTFVANCVAGGAVQITEVSGNNQQATVGTTLPQPLVVIVTDSNNNPVEGVEVNFAVIRGGGSLSKNQDYTNANGYASTILTLGTKADTNIVEATSSGLQGSPVRFTAVAQAAIATKMILHSGNNQIYTIGRELKLPLKVLVTDEYDNPVKEVPITFIITEGGGSLAENQPVNTGANGIASTRLTLGQQPGTNTVYAIKTGLYGSPIIFTATGIDDIFPELSVPSEVSTYENQPLMFTISASDEDGDPLTFGTLKLPEGASFDSTGTQTFSWTPNYEQAGSYQAVFIVRDNRGGFDIDSVAITVINVNRAPQIISYNPTDSTFRIGRDSTLTFSILAEDPDQDNLTYQWTDNDKIVSNIASYTLVGSSADLGGHTVIVYVSDYDTTVTHQWRGDVLTAVELASFVGEILEYEGIKISWQTSVEINNVGFNLFRSTTKDGKYKKINEKLIPSNESGRYGFLDRSAKVGVKYFYKLEDISIQGTKTLHGPIVVEVPRPLRFELSQNYPNPFNPETTIRYQLPKSGEVTVKIFNILGQQIKVLVEEFKEAGYYTVVWDGRDDSGRVVASGVYYYQIQAGNYLKTKRMILMR